MPAHKAGRLVSYARLTSCGRSIELQYGVVHRWCQRSNCYWVAHKTGGQLVSPLQLKAARDFNQVVEGVCNTIAV